MNKKHSLFILFILIKIFIGQELNYCNSEHYCNNCTICGEDNGTYCSCNFYNNYCLEEDSSKIYNNDFLQNYDGCLSSNGDMENVCGSSSITLTNGEIKTIYFKATNSSNFLCYYNIKKSDNNDNRIQYSITINGNSPPKFKLFLLLYFSDKQTKMQYISQSSISSDLYDEEDEIGFQKISIYLDVEDPQNLEELSITVSNIVESSTTTPTTISTTSNSLPPTYSPSPGNLTQPTYSPSPGNLTQPTDSPSPGDSSSGNYNLKSSGSNKGLIVGVVIGAIVLILGIILAVFLFKRCKVIEKNNINNTSNNIMTENNINLVNSNKKKMDALFKTELLPTVYNKNNVINDCCECTICMEDFIDNSSVIIKNKCGHIFHEKCFKNVIFKNIKCPKCPNCNYLILGPESEVISIP